MDKHNAEKHQVSALGRHKDGVKDNNKNKNNNNTVS